MTDKERPLTLVADKEKMLPLLSEKRTAFQPALLGFPKGFETMSKGISGSRTCCQGLSAALNPTTE